MENSNKYGLEIKGELHKKDAKMIAKIYAYAALLASILFGAAALVYAIGTLLKP
ncbi:hypothetical protein [Thiothrix sp.]|uniref:hypothetical protein n=1 Tax=Thiothrix sp. TaxID=1032 RepID=UPI00257AFC28|nr:hypothetical protein [Thiothrix sp.]